MTELHDHFKLLFAKIAVLHCRGCDRVVERDTAQSVFKKLSTLAEGTPVILTFALAPSSLPWEEIKSGLQRAGFHRLLCGQTLCELDDLNEAPASGEALQVVADRFAYRTQNRKRISDSLEQAFHYGKGKLNLFLPQEDWRREPFSNHLHCPHCDISYRDPPANLFSFNSPLGACETCRGFGRVIDIDLDLVIPDPGKSLSDGAIKPWIHRARRKRRQLDFCERTKIPTQKPNGEREFKGIRGWFRRLERRSYRMHVRVMLARYRAYLLCPECQGSRLKPNALHYRIDGKNMAEVNAMSVGEAQRFFDALKPAGAADQVARLILDEI
ncbi:MAG: hypothetical protein Q8O70_02550, partial [Burkholderiales bacterium]|nr:hypothetical protein [Burkholderiales bacterium]